MSETSEKRQHLTQVRHFINAHKILTPFVVVAIVIDPARNPNKERVAVFALRMQLDF